MDKPDLAKLFVSPMECRDVGRIPEGDRWQREPKLDGYRAIVVRQGKDTVIFSRRGHVFNRRFPGLAAALRELPGRSWVLDGEVVAFDQQGRMSFELVQEPNEAQAPLHFYAFDLLQSHGMNLLNQPLEERHSLLIRFMLSTNGPVHLCPVLGGTIQGILKQIGGLGLEGVVAKHKDSRYQPGQRPGTWVKFKVQATDEFIVGGYIVGTNCFDEVLVGKWEGRRLVFVESISDGFVPRSKRMLFEAMHKGETRSCPFSNLPERGARAMNEEKMQQVRWVEPKVVVEVAFNNWTEGGHLRHSRYLRLRKDKME